MQQISEMVGMLSSDWQRSHEEGCMHVARVSFLGTTIPFWKGTYLVRPVFLLLEGGISIIWKGRLPPLFHVSFWLGEVSF